MLRVVIDTNIFVSSFFGGNPKKIIDLWKNQKITLCLSSDIIDEYVDVLKRLKSNEQEIKGLLAILSSGFNLEFTNKTPDLKVVKDDPDDDKFIECAVRLKADVVISGDKALLKIQEYNGIKIISPKQFLEQFK